MTPTPRSVTLLNGMAGRDFAGALATMRDWGIRVLDLKDQVLGQRIEHLSDADAREAARLIADHGQQTYCFSTGIGFEVDLAAGREAFSAQFDAVDRVLATASILRPRLIRLLGPRGSMRAAEMIAAMPWAVDCYRDAVARITAAGFCVTIENEVHPCVFGSVDDVLGFFKALGPMPGLGFTYDIQNLWQTGTFPTIEVYQTLRPLIDYVHVKGGRAETPGGPLVWASTLADASWPVEPILRQVIADGRSPVICLNPTHGQKPPGWDRDQAIRADLAFLRSIVD